MNFFDAQDQSRRNTRRLLLVMTLAVVVVVISVTAVITASIWLTATPVGTGNYLDWLLFNPRFVVFTALGITAFIGFASLFRVVTLRQGGGKVARDLGGTLIAPGDTDPLRRRLQNVVEEMAIASGVPTPEIYVLEQEAGINAFAAGFSTEDAAIAVTRGTLETLTRDELQGVIAHEFSHIFNGDMRLNIQLMGPMFGILAIGLLGRILLRGGRFSGRSRGKGNGAAAILALGAGLMITGYVGLLLARLIKAGVSRQREYLADASAVQFTRQSKGIAGALKKIGGYNEHSTIRANDAEEVSHMLFASGFTSASQLLATHPPLFRRIKALDPTFTQQQFDQLHTETSQLDIDGAQISSLAGETAAAPRNLESAGLDSEALIASIGQPAQLHYQLARQFRADIPAEISDALESDYMVMLLIPALMLHPNSKERSRQLQLIEQQLGSSRRIQVEKLWQALAGTSNEIRLPLMQLALPLAKEQPAGRLQFLDKLLTQLAMQDNQLEVFEYTLLRTFQLYVEKATQPGVQRKWETLAKPAMQNAAVELLEIFTLLTFDNETRAKQALERGLARLNARQTPRQPKDWITRCDKSLGTLRNCTPRDRERVIDALLTAALGDERISQTEGELLRAFCGLLECPLPPLLQTSVLAAPDR